MDVLYAFFCLMPLKVAVATAHSVTATGSLTSIATYIKLSLSQDLTNIILKSGSFVTQRVLSSILDFFQVWIVFHTALWRSQRIVRQLIQVPDNFAQALEDSFNLKDTDRGTGSQGVFEISKAWLKHCDISHQSCAIPSGEPALPSRVIDVGNGTTDPYLLCTDGRRAKYSALSYCWGETDTLQATTKSLAQLQARISPQLLPTTLRDAIYATRQLGIQYLWIDALCIVQDDAEDWACEAVRMREIYANASVTLSANDACDSSEGLFRSRTT